MNSPENTKLHQEIEMVRDALKDAFRSTFPQLQKTIPAPAPLPDEWQERTEKVKQLLAVWKRRFKTTDQPARIGLLRRLMGRGAPIKLEKDQTDLRHDADHLYSHIGMVLSLFEVNMQAQGIAGFDSPEQKGKLLAGYIIKDSHSDHELALMGECIAELMGVGNQFRAAVGSATAPARDSAKLTGIA